jgi:hypothetical protein
MRALKKRPSCVHSRDWLLHSGKGFSRKRNLEDLVHNVDEGIV